MSIAVQFPRYIIVSAAALTVDFAVFIALTAAGTLVTVAGVVGYCAGLVLHFALSRRFVFANPRRKSTSHLITGFIISGLAGLVITAAVIAVAHDGFGAPPIVAKGLAVATSFIAVYMLRRKVVFSDDRR